ncbi:hypothetical protein MATL_G00001270 [Megalops atlanticus]|uniref:Uncharacterized protein n=1 Tax=Megalops atlanticus TaxID=7932 RepID=A0A9D3QGK4_MEGAT|nr:hypothetical protein MATL_G00001270 [Megalops atlanticus]
MRVNKYFSLLFIFSAPAAQAVAEINKTDCCENLKDKDGYRYEYGRNWTHANLDMESWTNEERTVLAHIDHDPFQKNSTRDVIRVFPTYIILKHCVNIFYRATDTEGKETWIHFFVQATAPATPASNIGGHARHHWILIGGCRGAGSPCACNVPHWEGSALGGQSLGLMTQRKWISLCPHLTSPPQVHPSQLGGGDGGSSHFPLTQMNRNGISRTGWLKTNTVKCAMMSYGKICKIVYHSIMLNSVSITIE